MDDVKQQVIDRLKQANNILVTVRNNPNVDLLSACIGLSLVLGKLDKHATAVFSGEVPSAMEFLKPEDTIEKTPNSLRDFIIALDKTKADKLRYKVEDKVVRIFITPYRTSITQDDLEFSQGDFNVDVIVALGAHEQQELDTAVASHGRILHDAAVISINNTPNGNLGSLNWQEISASSISEMVSQLADDMAHDAIDEQIATALLTGIVAETKRFSNDKTTPKTMNLAGKLMAAGANQQLVATKLEEGGQSLAGLTSDAGGKPSEGGAAPKSPDNGTLEIDHALFEENDQPKAGPEPEPKPAEAEPPKTGSREMLPMPEPGNGSSISGTPPDESPFTDAYNDDEPPSSSRSFLVDASETSDVAPKHEARIEPLPLPDTRPPAGPSAEPPAVSSPPLFATPVVSGDVPAPLAGVPPVGTSPDLSTNVAPAAGQTLEELEESVHSPHIEQEQPATDEPAKAEKMPGIIDEDYARMQVAQALNAPSGAAQPRLEPIQALNANPLGDLLHPRDDSTPPPVSQPVVPSPDIQVDKEGNFISLPTPEITPPSVQDEPEESNTPPMDMPLPSVMAQPPTGVSTDGASDQAGDRPAGPLPPPVPPPMMPLP